MSTAVGQQANPPYGASQQQPQQGYQQPVQFSQSPRTSPSQARPPYQVAERSTPIPATQISIDHKPNEHPLMPALRWANRGLGRMENELKDYSAVIVKRERISGKLNPENWMFVKVRHKPFSVYMYFLKPKNLEGQEVIFVEGANEGKMLAHGVGMQKLIGTIPLKPTSPIAMKDQRYPITELGVKNLIQRLLEVGNNDTRYGECEVKFLEGAKINDRLCTCIEVTHPVPRRNFLFHKAQIFVDEELDLPIRYASYDWKKGPDGNPELIEEYTYLNLKLNNGFTDADFDIQNPNYKFKGR